MNKNCQNLKFMAYKQTSSIYGNKTMKISHRNRESVLHVFDRNVTEKKTKCFTNWRHAT